MKILFLTDNFPPEVNAPATRTFEHCREWVKQGAEVTVLTCFPNYPTGTAFPGYKNQLYKVEYIEGIKVVRLWSYMTANEGFLKRVLDYISFAFMAFWAGLFKKTDIIVATSPQFFTALAGGALGFFKRVPWIFEVRDLWPESIRAVEAMRTQRILDWLEKLELLLYKKATCVVVVTEAFKDNLIRRGIKAHKIEVIKNGVMLDVYKPQNKNRQLLNKLGLKDKFVVAYMGTHGMAHKLDFLIESASRIKDPSVQLVFIGDGAEKAKLMQTIEKRKLPNVTMLDSVTKAEMVDYISITDVALVNLKKSDTFKTVIPSKIFENAAMRKPILLGVEGESQDIVEYYRAGLCFEPENESDFIEKLMTLRNNAPFYEDCQEGCTQLATDFDRIRLAHVFYKLMCRITETEIPIKIEKRHAEVA
jgi:glycosyltransferase involved in cell wall biosynthesis